MQVKLQKDKKILLNVSLAKSAKISAVRIWNYNGHRVHNNMGIRKCHIKLDKDYIFSGDIQMSSCSS